LASDVLFFIVSATAPSVFYTLSLHDALPIFIALACWYTAGLALPLGGSLVAALYVGVFEMGVAFVLWSQAMKKAVNTSKISNLRSEEHTSELQSRENLVCRLLLEKKKKNVVI